MTGAILFLAFIIAQRLGELWLARRNTAALLARGATEVAPGHYPLIVALHTGWVLCLVFFGWNNAISPIWLVLFAALQVFRVWILVTLGKRWTTRIIVLNEPLVARGPFRVLRHPNYALVVAEIFVAPMVLGLVWVAILFSILNGIALSIRIRKENAALAHLR